MDMALPGSRSRAKTTAFSEEDAAALRNHLDELNKLISGSGSGAELAESTISTKIGPSICSIHVLLAENSRSSYLKDAFRHLEGFQTILKLIRKTCHFLSRPDYSDEEAWETLEVLYCILNLLRAALQNHQGNRKFFRRRVEGWEVMKLIFTELLQSDFKRWKKISEGKEKLFGFILTFAFGNEALKDLFSRTRDCVEGNGKSLDGKSVEATSTALDRESNNGSFNVSHTVQWEACIKVIHESLGPRESLHNAEMIAIALELWKILRADNVDVVAQSYSSVVLLLPSILSRVADMSTHSLVALHQTGIVSLLLPIFLQPSLEPFHHVELQHFTIALLKLGITDLGNAHFLYRNAGSCGSIAELLRLTLGQPSTPPFIHFDLSLHGFASVELPDLGRSFPPAGSAGGYTLSIWIRVVYFDANSHTTIFGAFDSSQTCFVLVYLEKDTHNLILQTSVTSPKPSVRFKSFKFEHLRWYHVCLVHRRPKNLSSSRASLFVDGEFVEQVKAQYPSPPPSVISNTENHGPFPSVRKQKPVQAFFGTPQDLAYKLGCGVVLSQWQFASALLIDDILSDDLIAVHKELGPRYHGNYQDCLGSFQTYQASAALNLRNESLHPGKEENSDIVSAIRSKASNLLPESKVLLNISPTTVFSDSDRDRLDEAQFIRSLSKPAAKNLHSITRSGRTPIAINGAIPSINEALLHMYGFAVLTGEPAVVVPQCLDDAAWRVGGCAPVGLALIETANTDEEIIRALEILLGSVMASWRNSEAMERENGFGVLASLLTTKLGSGINTPKIGDIPDTFIDRHATEDLAFELLTRILHFVGYQSERPEDSVINNPLAYRILLVDTDVWRSCSYKVQKLYYEQFTTFATGSKHHCFNAKRLSRMREYTITVVLVLYLLCLLGIVKKWLDVLKGEDFYADTFDFFRGALRSLLGNTLSADSLRSLALYITYATHKPKDNTPNILHPAHSIRRIQSVSNSSRRRSTYSSSSSMVSGNRQERPKELTRLQIGVRILEMYADLLCQPEAINIKKFARTVTNKVSLVPDAWLCLVTLFSGCFIYYQTMNPLWLFLRVEFWHVY